MTDSVNKPSRNPKEHEDEIDLGRLIGHLIDHKWWIITITAVFMVFGVAYALIATPVYKADALLQIEEKSSGMAALGEMGEMFAQESKADAEIAIMKSRMVIGAVVDQLDLTNVVTPDYAPIIGGFLARRDEGEDKVQIEQFYVPDEYLNQELTLTISHQQFELESDDEGIVLNGRIGELTENNGFKLHISDAETTATDTFTLVKKSRLKTINDWTQRIAATERGKQSGIITASLEGENPEQIRRVLDAVTKEYLLQNIRRNAAEAENSLEFLNQQLPDIKDDLRAAENALNAYRANTESVDIKLETEGLLEQMVEYERRLNELAFKEAELSRLYTRQHPQYQALIEQKRQIEQDRQQLVDQIEGLPETQQEVLRLTRDVEVNQEIYLQLLNKVQELKVLRAGTVGNVRILDTAVTLPEPVAPKKPLIVVLATLLGGMLSVGLVLVKAAFNRGIESPQQLEELGINVYASIPKSDQQTALERKLFGKSGNAAKKIQKHRAKDAQRLPLLAESEPTDLSIEALRGLRTSLHFAMFEAKNKVVMISGPSPGVGKSFVSANLAVVLAQADQRILVIDADLRRGYLHNILHVGNENGLTDYLSKTVNNSTNIIKKTEIPNLDIISRGEAPPNPSELLMSRRMEALLEELDDQYDIILIDTPPILAVTDPAIVGKYSGTNLLVTRYGVNSAKEVEHTIERFEQNGIEIKGVIFNSIEKSAASTYGYGYGAYAYGYSYKS
jgi:tyrosine-protein kinase Etk/Wzc